MIPDPGFTPTVPGLIERFVARFGDAQAIVRDGRAVTFRELDQRSAHMAKALLARGVTKGARIAVLAPPGPDFVTAVLAIGRIGAIVGPLSTLYQAPELAWVLNRAEFEHLIVADAFLRHDYLARLEEALPGLAESGNDDPLLLAAAPRLRGIHVIGDGHRPWSRPFADLLAGDARISDAMLAQVEALVTPADPFCVIHTSGSTAEPKGVFHAHGPVIRHSWQLGTLGTPFALGDRLITTRAMFWVAGFIACLFYSLNNGACIVTTNDGSPANVLRLIREQRGTGLVGDAGWFDVLHQSDELREAGYGVVRLNMDSAGIVQDGRFVSDQLAARFGAPVHQPNARFARTFGMTETLGGHTTLLNDSLLPEDRPSWQGQPAPGVEVKIVDPQTRVECPIGEVGELLVRGYCLMLGLNGRERHETFDAEGFYPTGDLCRMDREGYIKFEARLGEMIKVHGANVAPLEVELALAGLMGIEKAGVVGIEQGHDTLLAAGVVMAPGRTLDEAAVTADLKTKLSSYKVPKRIIALSDAQMPQTGSGKVKKAELQALLATLI